MKIYETTIILANSPDRQTKTKKTIKKSSYLKRNAECLISIIAVTILLVTLIIASIQIHTVEAVEAVAPQPKLESLDKDIVVPVTVSYPPKSYFQNTVVTTNQKSSVEKIYKNIKIDGELQQYAYQLCKENNVPFDIFMALIWKESSYDATQMSRDGHDYGLCQIRDCNFAELREKIGMTDIMDPKQNIESSIYILAPFLEKYKNDPAYIHLALMCYNMGEDRARECWKDGKYSSYYSRDIVAYAKKHFNVSRKVNG